jgi:hypothetical protein
LRRLEDVLKSIVMNILALILVGGTNSAFAAPGSTELASSSMLIWFFIGFGVMVLLFQVTPALITFYSMLKGLFSTAPAETTFSPFKNSKNGK